MASITIKYTAPEVLDPMAVDQIPAMFWPNNSYVDTEVYEGTIWDTNVEGWGAWDGLADYLDSISMHKGLLLMFKKAVREGEATFEAENEIDAEYCMEVGRALAKFGFEVSDGSNESSDGDSESDDGN